MQKTCFILAVTLHKKQKLYVLKEILEMIKDKFYDTKVFIGINYGSIEEVEPLIDSYGMNVTYRRLTEEKFYCKSDASAYQIALELMYSDSTKYDVCWFMHTKGAFNDRDTERRLYINEFYSKRNLIEKKFELYDYLGVYGYRAGEFFIDPNNPVDKSDNFVKMLWDNEVIENFKYTFSKVILIETMFCMRGKLIYDFLNLYPNFFTTPLRSYFFECEFANFIPTRQGYYQGIILGAKNWFNGTDMQHHLDSWIDENKLIHLSDYKFLI